MQTGPQPYAEYYLRPGDIGFYGVDFEGWLATQWEGGIEVVAATNVVRPTKPNGFEFLCTASGQTAADEPVWPTVVGTTVNDGSAVWTCQDVTTAPFSSTVQSVTWTAPSGVTVRNQALSGAIATAMVDASVSVAGSDYDVKVVASLADGENKTAVLRFKVR